MKYGSEQILPYNGEEQKSTQVRRMFDSIAGTYDLLNHTLSFGIDKIWRRKAIASLRPFSPQSILDIATGTGDLAISMHRKLKARQIIGADISEGMMQVGREKVARAGLLGIYIIRTTRLYGAHLPRQFVRRRNCCIRSTQL